MYRVEVSRQAHDAVLQIDVYLGGFAHPADIATVLDRVAVTLQGLRERPERHPRYHLASATDVPIRRAPAGKYHVYFLIDEAAEVVHVLDIHHRRRDPAVIRRRLEGSGGDV